MTQHEEEKAAAPVVVVAGSAGVGKSKIARCLVHGSGPATHAASRGSQHQEHQLWEIDTKYYTAQVVVSEHAMHRGPLAGPSHPEALVMVVDCGEASSFEAARQWAEQQPDLMEMAEIKLLLANKADLLPPEVESIGSSPRQPGWLQGAMDWCAESGIEYVEVCASDPSLDAGLELNGDQQGMARVVQALHAHMWPGLVLKEKPGHAVGSTGPGPLAGASAVEASLGGGESAEPRNGHVTAAETKWAKRPAGERMLGWLRASELERASKHCSQDLMNLTASLCLVQRRSH
jgi:hypothetical protein